MLLDTKNVVVIRDGVVASINSYPNTPEGNQEAEKCFVDMLEQYLSNFDEYSQTDIAAVLDNGYERNGAGDCICIAVSE